MRAMLVAVVLLAVALAGAQAQQLYRWVDKDGKINYTQQPPPPDAKNVQRRALSSGTVDSGDLPYATQVAAKKFPVTLFTSPDCGAGCKDAREMLEKRGVPFEEVVVADEKSVEELKRLTGRAQVPVLRVGTQMSVGFESEGWKTELDAAGYPASAPLQRARLKADGSRPLPPVKLYTSAECGGLCEEARTLLTARRVNFNQVEVDYSNPETVEELMRVAGGSQAVPVLVVGQRVQRGFDSGTYHTVLDAAGFPRAAEDAARPGGPRQ